MAQENRISGSIGVVRLFGVPIRLHFTFVLLLLFLLFIGFGGKQSTVTMVVYILALFGSVLLHELGHAVVARRYGIRTIEIVMFPIGGLARLDRQPRAREELWIALAGPAVNLVIALGIVGWLYAAGGMAQIQQMQTPTDANLAQRIAAGNLILALFNMLPAYPMDGGRVLRSLLAIWKPEDEATQIASSAGKGMAFFMGLYGLISGNFILVFIAMFVYLGASQEGMAARGRTLALGYPVSSAMVTDFRTLGHGSTMREAADLLLATSQQDFPVLHGSQVVGLLKRNDLIRSMLTTGPDGYVAGAMDREFLRLQPSADLADVLPSLSGSCALVMDGDELLGLLTAENLSEFLVLRQVRGFKDRVTSA